MTTRTIKQPGADHPITIEPAAAPVAVSAGGTRLAESRRALTLREADYPPVQYLPRDDVAGAELRPSATTSYCPYKGDCSYFDLALADGHRIADAAWSYEQPYPAVAEIAGLLAFYPDKVTVELLGPSA